MKNLFLSAAILLTSASALAASDYSCKMTITDKGEEVGTLIVNRAAVGTDMGTLANVTVSVKKNIFGKEKRRVELALVGRIDNMDLGLDHPESYSIDAKVQQIITRNIGKINTVLR